MLIEILTRYSAISLEELINDATISH